MVLRQRVWRHFVVLGLVAGLGAGLILGTDSAYARVSLTDLQIQINDLQLQIDELEGEQLDSRSVPVGGVISWWRPNDSFPVPEGFQICDGSPILSGPYTGANTPDLTDHFVRGVGNASDIGTTGGQATDSFEVSSSQSGRHNHKWAYVSGIDWYTYNPGGSPYKVTDWDDGIDTSGSGFYPLGGTGSYYTRHSTEHSHQVFATIDTIPPYVGLLQIMRIF